MATGRSKMATRLPSTGLKMAKMANHTENGDTCDRCDTFGAVAGWPWRLGGRPGLGCALGPAQAIAAVMNVDELPG